MRSATEYQSVTHYTVYVYHQLSGSFVTFIAVCDCIYLHIYFVVVEFVLLSASESNTVKFPSVNTVELLRCFGKKLHEAKIKLVDFEVTKKSTMLPRHTIICTHHTVH